MTNQSILQISRLSTERELPSSSSCRWMAPRHCLSSSGVSWIPIQPDRPYVAMRFAERFGLKDPKRSANRIATYGLSGWIGIQDTPEELKQWRGAIQRQLEELGSSRSVDSLEICNMLWFVITDKETDQTPQGKGSNLLAGTAAQITDKLKRYKEAGLTMPLLWPPFQNVPVPKTLDDLKRLKEEIMPKVDAT